MRYEIEFEQTGQIKTTLSTRQSKIKPEHRRPSVSKIKDRGHHSPFLPTPSPT